jgi:endonuclease/exonuclease/phosphatase family metal-dependent hydrolase
MCAHSRQRGHGIPESLPGKVAALARMAAAQQWSVIALQECPPLAAGGVNGLLGALTGVPAFGDWQRDGVTLALSDADTERGLVLHDDRVWRRIGQAVTYPNAGGAFKRAPLLVALASRAKPELVLAVVSVHLKSRGQEKGGDGTAQNIREIEALARVAAWAREQVPAMAAADPECSSASTSTGSSAKADAAAASRRVAYAIIGDFNAPPTEPAFEALASAGFAPVLRDTATNMSELLLGGVPAQYDNAWLCTEAWAGDAPWLVKPGGHAVLPFPQAQFNDYVKLLAGLRDLEDRLADSDVKEFAHSLVRAASAEPTKIRSSDHKAISVSCYFAGVGGAAAAAAAAPRTADALAAATPPSRRTGAEGGAPPGTDGSTSRGEVSRAINFAGEGTGAGATDVARSPSPPAAAASTSAPPSAATPASVATLSARGAGGIQAGGAGGTPAASGSKSGTIKKGKTQAK